MKNILIFKKSEDDGYTKAVEFHRFGDGTVMVEASDSDGCKVLTELDFDEVKKLLDFLGGLVGMLVD